MTSAVATCEVYQVDLPGFNLPNLSASFKEGATEAAASGNWKHFFEIFGTNYAYSVVFGGRCVQSTLFKTTQVQLVNSIGIDIAAGAKFNFAEFSGDIDTDWHRHKEEIQYFNSSYSEIHEVYIGSNPPKSGDWHDWQEGVRDAPAPIKYYLGTMTDLITKENFPTNYMPIRDSLRKALKSYCKNMKYCEAPDPDKPFPKPAKTVKHLTKEVGVAMEGEKFEDPDEKNPMMGVRQVQIRSKPCGSSNYPVEERLYNIQFVMSDGVKTMITPKHGDIDCGLLSTWNVPTDDEISQVLFFDSSV